jgi:transcriptional regulator with XRE-family HTH domain
VILTAVGVSAAALSQYARDETRPSFRRLVALADFFGVSLDYLVFGEPTRKTVDHSPLARHVDRALAQVQTRANRHAVLVARIGRVLAERVSDIAWEVADSPSAGREGMISDDEILRLQRYAHRIDLVTVDLAADLIGSPDVPSSAAFVHAVAANLLRGCEYRLLVAGGGAGAEPVSSFRSLLTTHVGGDLVHQSCQFRRVTLPVMFGAGCYQLDVGALARQEPQLHAQVSDYLDQDRWLGYVTRTNAASKNDMLLGREQLTTARDTFDALWATSIPW